MSDKTKIEWTDATWNPVTGCDRVSPGCDHCYALTLAERFRGTPGHYFESGFDVQLRPDKLDQPLRWKKPRKVFVNSMSDLFHKDIPEMYIAGVFAVMARAPQHTFQVLTKRHGRMRSLLNSSDFQTRVMAHDVDAWPLPNVWMGVSAEDQRWANVRVPSLLATPAAVRFVSAEPLLGPIDFNETSIAPLLKFPDEPNGETGRIDWVIVGGESGRGARKMEADWARGIRDQCTRADVAFHFKQWGTHGGTPKSARELDGRTWDEFPA